MVTKTLAAAAAPAAAAHCGCVRRTRGAHPAAAAAFLLVAFCRRYGADLVDGWVNDRAHGDMSEESYFQRVLRRRAEREEAMKECPVKRKARLVKRLEEEGVVMVRSTCCVLVGRKRRPRSIIGDGDG